ncbi:MAG: hypothetical protein FJ368_05785, partial [Pelagibacterales bacterium]|nr:hypothetical protein [Pelagibacterales bacterium]
MASDIKLNFNFMKKISRIFFTVFIFINVICQKSFAENTVVWNSSEGLKRLDQSLYKNDFYQLINYYQPQNNPLFCSIATGTIFLNAFYTNSEIESQKENEVRKPQ